MKLKLNFDKMETTEEKVDTDSIAKVSEKSLINYEVSKKITRLTKPMGEIERISAAVVIDDALLDVREQRGELVFRRINAILKEARLPNAEEVEIPRVDREKLSALQEAQHEIVEVVRNLEEKGVIVSGSAGGDEYVV